MRAARDLGLVLALLLPALAVQACAAASPGGPGELVVYAAREEELVGPIVARFQEDTGIRVRVKYGGATQIVAALLEEGEGSPADLFWTRDPGGLGAASPLLAPLPQGILDRVPPWARSRDGDWVGISARVRALVYNPERVSTENLPGSLWGLTDPLWRGRVGWSPTSSPTQTMITAMRLVWGEERTLQWLEAMERNGAVGYGNHISVVAAVSAGEVDAGLVNHYYAHRFRQERGGDVPVENYYFRDGGPGNLAMVSGAGVLATAKNPRNAEAFLRFMLAAPAQEYFSSQTFEYPVVEGVAVNEALTPLSAVNRPAVNMDDLGDLRGTLVMLRDVGVIP